MEQIYATFIISAVSMYGFFSNLDRSFWCSKEFKTCGLSSELIWALMQYILHSKPLPVSTRSFDLSKNDDMA